MNALERRAHRCAQYAENSDGVRRAGWLSAAARLFRRAADEGASDDCAQHAVRYAELAGLCWRATADDYRLRLWRPIGGE